MSHRLVPPSAVAADGSAMDWPSPGLKALGAGASRSFRYVLVLRAAVLNIAALALLGAAFLQGLVIPLFQADTTGTSHLIAAVFVVGLALCARRLTQLSHELNAVKDRAPTSATRAGRFLLQAPCLDPQARASLAAALRLSLGSRIAGIRQLANHLVLLGLIGTVVGFIMALSGVDPDRVGDAAAIAPMVSSLIAGMGVALNTTLVGSILNIWLMLNVRLLEAAAVSLWTQLVELAEEGARA